jgi:predicted DNA-binding transcriptional regulator AlpA
MPQPVSIETRRRRRGAPATLSAIGWLRERQILGDPDSDPPTPAIVPVSRSTWWRGVREGRVPRGTKISSNATAWRVEEILALVERLGSSGGAA